MLWSTVTPSTVTACGHCGWPAPNLKILFDAGGTGGLHPAVEAALFAFCGSLFYPTELLELASIIAGVHS